MMDMVSSLSNAQQAQTATNVQFAVASKVMKTTADLQADMISQLMGSMGIGNNLDTVA